MAQAGHDHAGHRELDILAGLVHHDYVKPGRAGQVHAAPHARRRVTRHVMRPKLAGGGGDRYGRETRRGQQPGLLRHAGGGEPCGGGLFGEAAAGPPALSGGY